MSTRYTATDFIGTWLLTGWDRLSAGQLLERPLGEQPVGFLTYEECGLMQVQMMSQGRRLKVYRSPRDAANASLRGQAVSLEAGAEVAAVYSSFAAYAGRYEIDAIHDVIRHHILTAIDPKMLGGFQERLFRFPGKDSLELQVRPYNVNGSELTDVLRWKRAVTDPVKPRS